MAWLQEIARQRVRDLAKPLKVHFIGEEGVDDGGLRKEFFQLLVQQLLHPDYGEGLWMKQALRRRFAWWHMVAAAGDSFLASLWRLPSCIMNQCRRSW